MTCKKEGKEGVCAKSIGWDGTTHARPPMTKKQRAREEKQRDTTAISSLPVAYRAETRWCLKRVSTQLRDLRQRTGLALLSSERSVMEMSIGKQIR